MHRKENKHWLYIILIISAIVLYPFIFNSSAKVEKPTFEEKASIKVEKSDNYKDFIDKLINDFRYQMALFKKAKVENGKYVYFEPTKQIKVIFTIDPDIQEKIKREFKRYRLKYGAFVAIEPETGKVLTAVSSLDYPDLTLKNTFVAASTFKIVTAAAAIESGIDPKEKFITRGHDDSCSPRVWLKSSYIIPRNMYHSFAYSSNPYFGVIGRLLGTNTLMKYAYKFGFNRSDYGFPWGIIRKPLDDYDLALTAAGLSEVRVSPFHEALISAVIENRGTMILPTLIDEIYYKDKLIYSSKPIISNKVIKEKTAAIIKDMMIDTVKFGTASHKKFFRKLRRITRHKRIIIGGKTGTLSQLNYPEGRCEWFTGFVEIGNKKLAITSLAVNDAKYYITGYDVAALSLITMIKNHKEKFALK